MGGFQVGSSQRRLLLPPIETYTAMQDQAADFSTGAGERLCSRVSGKGGIVDILSIGWLLCAAMTGSALRNEFHCGGLRRSRLSVAHPGEVSLRTERMATDNPA